MSTLIEQLLLDDPSQIIERGNFFEISSEGIIRFVTDQSDEYISNKVVNKILNRLAESSEHLKKILNTNLSKVRNIDIEFSSEEFEELRNRKEELIIDSFYYQINFNVDFILNYFENISKIYLTICPSFGCGLYGDKDPKFIPQVLDIGVTGYLCYESNGHIFHQEKLSFKPRATAVITDLFWSSVKNLPIWIRNVFKYYGDYNGTLSLFKEEIAEKLALLM
jgi:hypothetical protein